MHKFVILIKILHLEDK